MSIAEFFSSLSTWSILLFVLGIALIVVEMFQPGFGVAGVGGILCLIVDIFITANSWLQGLILAAALLVLLALLFAIFVLLSARGHFPGRLVLRDSTDAEAGFSAAEDLQYLMGRRGVAATDLRPSGNADFDGVKLDVVTRGEFVERGSAVAVIEVEGNRIVVKAL